MRTIQEHLRSEFPNPRTMRLWDVKDDQKIVVACACGQIAHFLPGVLQRLRKLPSDTRQVGAFTQAMQFRGRRFRCPLLHSPVPCKGSRKMAFPAHTRVDAMDDLNYADFERLAKSHDELSAHVIALTAILGTMASTASVDYERLEECVNFAAKRLRPGRRPILFDKASLVLSDLEAMQKTLRIEVRKVRNLRKRSAKSEKPRHATL
jgi:hypothetical protein